MATRDSDEIINRLTGCGWAIAPDDPGEPTYGDPDLIDPVTKRVYALRTADIIQASRDLLPDPSHDPAH